MPEQERAHEGAQGPKDVFEELAGEEDSGSAQEERAEEELVPVKRGKKARMRKKIKDGREISRDSESEISRPLEKEEPVELTVSASQKKTVSDEETDIVKPKKQKWKEPQVAGIKEEKHETDIYKPEKEKKFTIKVRGELEQREETDIYKPVKKQEEKWALEREVPEEELKEEGIHEEDVVEDLEVESEDFETEPENPGAKGEERISTEGIRRKILEKARSESVRTSETSVPLKFLQEGDNVFVGMKKSVHSKYGMQGALYVGKVGEAELQDKNVFLDSLNPHVVFVCGSRGSGKSYVLGVIAEELALKNNNVGIVVIDPIGVFWSMRFPNREKKELEAMAEWNIMPEGLKNLKVFIPEGMASETPKNTYDATFNIQPSLLTSDDWCLTFGIDRFSPTGLLLEKAVKKVEAGFRTLQTSDEKAFAIKGKGKKYGIDDIVHCLEKDSEINSREKGFKQDSVRALVSRFGAAKNWGIFSDNGTPLSEFSREGQLTVLDTSFLEDNVTALVIGILARRLLAARKLTTRKEASARFKEKDMDQVLELEVPATWLFIDEAHTLIPSGNVRTPASAGLIEYVKQGRRPGLSLVFATQQPSAIDTKVLSQLDIIMTHKLVFDDDIKAVYKRTPTIIPSKYRKATFIKTLPVGVALTGDRAEETSRAFIMRIRPRMSQHEGRDAVTMESAQELSQEEVQALALSLARGKLEREGVMQLEKLQALIDTLNTKYKAQAGFNEILKKMEAEGSVIDKAAGTISKKGYKPVETQSLIAEKTQTIGEEIEEGAEVLEQEAKEREEATELVAIPPAISERQARKAFDKARKKKLLGFLGEEERIASMQLKYVTVWKVLFNEYNLKKEFARNECYIDSSTGEFLHYNGREFLHSKGASTLHDASEEELEIVKSIALKKKIPQASEQKFRKTADRLVEKGILRLEEKNGVKKYSVDEKLLDLPPGPGHEMLSSIGKMRFVTVQALGKEMEKHSKEEAIQLVQKLWPSIIVKKVEEVHRPIFEAVLERMNGETKTLRIDAVSGKEIKA